MCSSDLAEALEAVEIAEGERDQNSLDSAKVLVDALEDGDEKDGLLARLDAIQDEITQAEEDESLEQERVALVDEIRTDIETLVSLDDVKTIQLKIDSLAEHADKTDLQSELDAKKTSLEDGEAQAIRDLIAGDISEDDRVGIEERIGKLSDESVKTELRGLLGDKLTP